MFEVASQLEAKEGRAQVALARANPECFDRQLYLSSPLQMILQEITRGSDSF